MRQKRTALARRDTGSAPPPSEPTADWLVENEIGWGLPHLAVAVIAGVLIAIRALTWQEVRLAAWLARRRPG